MRRVSLRKSTATTSITRSRLRLYSNLLTQTRKYTTQTTTDKLIDKKLFPSSRAKSLLRVTPEDIIPVAEYQNIKRDVYYPMRRAIKKIRQIEIGPFASITFENYDLVWVQIQEMLAIEPGGPERIQEELIAYNPLIPNQNKLVMTLMFEIDDANRRARVLSQLGHVEDTVYLTFRNERIRAVPADEDGIERTTASGKTSAVHFLAFPFDQEKRATFLQLSAGDDVRVMIEHNNYPHATKLSYSLVESLKDDLRIM